MERAAHGAGFAAAYGVARSMTELARPKRGLLIGFMRELRGW